MRIFLTLFFLSTVLGFSLVAEGNHFDPRKLAKLTIAAPESSFIRIRRRQGITTFKYTNRRGIMSTTQWPLIFRIESKTAVGFVEQKMGNKERGALVLTDRDECFNLFSLIEDLMVTSFDPACVGFGEDETYIEVQTERQDTFGVNDNTTTGNDAIRARLIDDLYSDPPPRNKPYLDLFNGGITPVGAQTGGRPDPASMEPFKEPALDGFGLGTDDDLAGLVVMANVGSSRVFDKDFVLMPGIIRNMAGMANSVATEDLDGRNQTAVTISYHVLAGVFEPIALVDADTVNPNFDYAIQVDSGPVTPFNLDTPFPSPELPPVEVNAFYDEILSLYYPVEITIRAVLVNREAPDFIMDEDGDGEFTARDVKMAGERDGYELASNEVQINLTLTHENLLTDSPDVKCPSQRTFFHSNIDDNFAIGELPECKGTSGSTRSRRVPR